VPFGCAARGPAEVACSCPALVLAEKYDTDTSSATSAITIHNNGLNEGARRHRLIGRSQHFERAIASAGFATAVAGSIVSEGASDI